MDKIQITNSYCHVSSDGEMRGCIEGVFKENKRVNFFVDFDDDYLEYSYEKTRLFYIQIYEVDILAWIWSELNNIDYPVEKEFEGLLADLLADLEISWPMLFKVEIRKLANQCYTIDTKEESKPDDSVLRKIASN